MRKNVVFSLATLGLLLGVVGCAPAESSSGSSQTSKPTSQPSSSEVQKLELSVALKSGASGLNIGDEDTVVVTASDQGQHSYSYHSSAEAIVSVDKDGKVKALAEGVAVITVKEETAGVEATLNLVVGNRGYNYATGSYDDKAEILGKLEKYAMDEHLTGISLFENGGYVMYKPRIQKGSETFINGYGFGILSEGKITAPMAAANEPKEAWRNYYHLATASDPKNINALNNKGSEVDNLFSNISSSYFGTKMNEFRDGYEWYPVLAKDGVLRPKAINPDEASGYATVWEIPVKTGADGLTYSTLSKKYAKFNNRPVALEDYVFAYKLAFTGAFNLYRGVEKAGDQSYGIVGADKYLEATKNMPEDGSSPINDEAFNRLVGVKAIPERSAIQIEMVRPLSPFYAMYGLNSNLFQPMPKEFMEAIGDGDIKTGVLRYGAFGETNGTTPVDNVLSLGAYTLESWEKDKTITFKRNPNWVEFSNPELADRYSIEGIKYTVLKAMAEDTEAAFKEYMLGNLDVTSIPLTKIKEYRNHEETTQTKGDSVFKLNVNSTTKEEWEQLFGVNGSVTQTEESNYWNVKPWMSNDNFLNGLNSAIDRKTFAENRGVVPSNEYFSSNYLINPEEGLAYNNTPAHEEAMKNYYPETQGYNFEVAKEYFRLAVEELVEEGSIELGTQAKPTTISLDIWWMYQADIKDYGDEISLYLEKAFNDPSVSDGCVVLKVNNDAVTQWDDVYYKHLMVGQFDLGFGSISGNSFDPLNFMEVLKSDNSSGFTLNWGTDTSVVSNKLIYDNRPWAFDTLWEAADSGLVVDKDGLKVQNVDAVVDLANSSWDIVSAGGQLKIELAVLDVQNVDITLTRLDLYIVNVGNLTLPVADNGDGTLSVVLSVEDIQQIAGLMHTLLFGGDPEIDPADLFLLETYGLTWELELYYEQSINGTMPIEKFVTLDLK